MPGGYGGGGGGQLPKNSNESKTLWESLFSWNFADAGLVAIGAIIGFVVYLFLLPFLGNITTVAFVDFVIIVGSVALLFRTLFRAWTHSRL